MKPSLGGEGGVIYLFTRNKKRKEGTPGGRSDGFINPNPVKYFQNGEITMEILRVTGILVIINIHYI